VTDGHAEAAFQGLENELAIGVCQAVLVNLKEPRHLETFEGHVVDPYSYMSSGLLLRDLL